MFALAPHASLMALQCVLQDWTSRIRDEKIIQIAHANTIQMRNISVKGDGFSVICEALCAALAMDFKSAQQEIERFDEILMPKSTYGAAKERFQLWKIISSFHRNQGNAKGYLINAQRLEDEAERMGEECTVLVETACHIRKACGDQEEEIIRILTNTVIRHPSLVPKMIYLAEKFGVSYEISVFLQQLGDLSLNLHPSEPMWLKYVEIQVKSVGRFESIRGCLLKLLKIMFEFLDFDANRFNEKAWKLMKRGEWGPPPSPSGFTQPLIG
uniref:Uncharacterized protein n=1 Tax=Caenorhabditis japonica TaxID=281687 RepID=A0A8R1I512_CAEJA